MTRRGRRELLSALAYLVPSLAVFVLFVFYPLARNAQLSLYETDPFGGLGDADLVGRRGCRL